MKSLVGAFNQEKALVGAFSVIVQPVVEPMEHCTALLPTHLNMTPGSSSPCTYLLDLYQRLVFRLIRDSWAVRGWW